MELAGAPECGQEVMAHFGVEANGPPHLMFRDGTDLRDCRRSDVLAAATLGGPVVWICPRQFNRLVWSAPDRALVTLVHEVLHTQGLPEAPVRGAPSSLEISQAVARTCELGW